jgi:hypothetical protein
MIFQKVCLNMWYLIWSAYKSDISYEVLKQVIFNMECLNKWYLNSLLIKYHVVIPHKISHVHSLSKTTCYIFEYTKHLFYIYLLGKPTVKHYTYRLNTWYFKRCVWTCDIWYEVHTKVIFHMKCLSKWYLIWSV